MDIMPYSYQQEILDKLEAERKVRGYTRNLVVAATGTGKTVISALDYKHFRKQNPDKPCRWRLPMNEFLSPGFTGTSPRMRCRLI